MQDKLSGLGCYLVTNGYLEQFIAHEAETASQAKNISLISYLCSKKFISYLKLAEAIADYFGLCFFDLNCYDLSILPKDILSTELIQKYLILPLFKNNNKLTLAVYDPSLPNLNEINFLTGLRTVLVVVEYDKLTKKLNTIIANHLQVDLKTEEKKLEATIDLSDLTEENDCDFSSTESDQAPTVTFLNKLLLDAINQQASDIHFEPYDNGYRIRYRIDGILYEMSHQPLKLANYLTSRLKVMANLDISERRLPQDGRFKVSLGKNKAIDFRLSICPTLYGEKAVVRILNSSTGLLDINALGMNEHQKRLFIDILSYSQGMILVTGPTGSGKTVTLYTALHKLNTSSVNISSVEDPIEIYLPGINQVQVNIKTGLTFATALRAFLRQDPDIMMVGEIRDRETAEIAVKAAQTGHLMLSTLHTNSATETLIRLANIGIESFNIASTILLIVAQRLVRRLCQQCKSACELPKQTLIQQGFTSEQLNNVTTYKATGCLQCNNGYKGRVGIYEVMPVSKAMAQLIMENAGPIELAAQAKKENISSLRSAGIEKVIAGITSLEEVNRVIKE